MKPISRSREGSARPRIRHVGVPVRAVNRAWLNPGCNRDGNPCVYATMGQRADNFFVLQIDPETGDSRQFFPEFPPKDANYPTGVIMSRTGRLYIGAAYAGHLFCFDPEKDMLEDLGAATPDALWLTEMRETGGAVVLTGQGLDNQTIALFMRQLEASPYFSRVDLVETKHLERGQAELKEFTIRAQVVYAGVRQDPKPVGGVEAPS